MNFNENMILNPDKNKVEEIKNKLKNNPHCPCMIVENENTLCPCKPCRERSICICGLYINKNKEDK